MPEAVFSLFPSSCVHTYNTNPARKTQRLENIANECALDVRLKCEVKRRGDVILYFFFFMEKEEEEHEHTQTLQHSFICQRIFLRMFNLLCRRKREISKKKYKRRRRQRRHK